jgi:haloalkane dehalogenase
MMPDASVTTASPAGVDRVAYPFESRWLDVGPGRIHYVDEGQGETLLFVHGTPTWSFDWRHLVGAFRSSHRCVALDLVGFGLSDRPSDFAYTPEAHAVAVAAFVERLGLTSFTLIAHDFGGPIALPLCLDHPERVERLVLLNTWMWSVADDRRLSNAARLLGTPLGRFLYERANLSLRVLMPNAFADKAKLTREVHQHSLDRFPDARSRGMVLWRLARSLLGSSAYYDALWQRRDRLRGRPTLVMWGMADAAFPPTFLERWRSTLPDARVVELSGAGHWPHEEMPERVIDELRVFLGR